jgi:uncharacterized membrane protein YqaE (UPF0057 family)
MALCNSFSSQKACNTAGVFMRHGTFVATWLDLIADCSSWIETMVSIHVHAYWLQTSHSIGQADYRALQPACAAAICQLLFAAWV